MDAGKSPASTRKASQSNLDIYRQAMNENVNSGRPGDQASKGKHTNNSPNLDTESEEAVLVSALSSSSNVANEATAPRNAPSFLLFAFCFAIASALFLFQHPGLGFVLCVLLSCVIIKGLLATTAGQVFKTATIEVEQAQKQKIPFTPQKDVGTKRHAARASDAPSQPPAAPAPAPSHDLASTTVVLKKEPVKVQRTAPAQGPTAQSADLHLTPQAQYSTKVVDCLMSNTMLEYLKIF